MPIAVRMLTIAIPCSRKSVRMRSASVVSSWRSRLMISRILLIWDRRAALFVERTSSLARLSSSMSESSPCSRLIRSLISCLISASSVSVSFLRSLAKCFSTGFPIVGIDGMTFNDYSRVIWATGDADASYSVGNLSLEYDMVTQPELARMIANQYNGRLAILYGRILRHRKISKDKSNILWNINLNVPARSMKGVLMLFEDVAAQ